LASDALIGWLPDPDLDLLIVAADVHELAAHLPD
jgi:hypothetical protein